MVQYGMPMQFAPARQATPQYTQQAQPQQRQWQAPSTPSQGTPSLAYIAAGVTPPQAQPPYKARGVAQEAPPAPKKFVMPSPEELGVATNLNVKSGEPSRVSDRVLPAIDWNLMHTRMNRIGVLKFEKDRVPTTGNVRVTLLLPTSDPTLAQPVVAVAATEAEAVLSAVQYAETWMQRR